MNVTRSRKNIDLTVVRGLEAEKLALGFITNTQHETFLPPAKRPDKCYGCIL